MFFGIMVSVILALVVCKIIGIIVTRAIVFSKIVVSLFIAMVLNNETPIIEGGGFMGFLAWAAVVLVVCFGICLLPRVNCAFQFLCNCVVSYILAELLAGVVYGMLRNGYGPTVLGEVIVKAICAAISMKTLLDQLEMGGGKKITNKLLILVDRSLAAVIFSVAGWILICVSMNSVWEFPLGVNIAVFLGLVVLAFAADVLFFEKLSAYIRMRRSIPSVDNGKEIDKEMEEEMEKERMREFYEEWKDNDIYFEEEKLRKEEEYEREME